MDKPPRSESVLGKRPREWTQKEVDTAREIINRNVELEISLRQRAAEAAEAKIRWAEAMKLAIIESIQRSSPFSDAGNQNQTSIDAFRREAAETLRAIERVQPLRRSPSPPISRLLPADLAASALTYPDTEDTNLASSSIPTPCLEETLPTERSPSPPSPTSVSKSLYITQSSSSSSRPLTLLISCETCTRSDFPTIHSLLSHSRMSHGTFYRSHEELVSKCSRVVRGDEEEKVRRYGVEASGKLLFGMRSVIERLVVPVADGEEAGDALNHPEGGDDVLARTLGVHRDSKELAEFLGRQARHHSIRVYEPEGDIDIETVDEDVGFRMSPDFLVRNRIQKRRSNKCEEEENDSDGLASLHNVHIHTSNDVGAVTTEPKVAESSSRFHLKRRVVISDSSHFMTEKERPLSGHTHQWMITVSAPSYSEHITTFLSKFTITQDDSDPTPSKPTFYSFASPATAAASLDTPLNHHLLPSDSPNTSSSVSTPPYSIIGTSSSPFLAKITLEWVGGPSLPLVITHWVRLDASKTTRTVVGDDQILDVELNRGTPFREAQIVDVDVVKWLDFAVAADKSPHVQPSDRVERSRESKKLSKKGQLTEAVLDAEDAGRIEEMQWLDVTLRRLAAKIPMTSQDLRSRSVDGRTVSYKLPRSLNDLLELDHGRRKYHEWRHAISLKNMLLKQAATDATLSARLPELRRLTTGSLYRWLDFNSIFTRPSFIPGLNDSDDTIEDYPVEGLYCRYCGLDLGEHPKVEIGTVVEMEERIEGIVYDPPKTRSVICPEATNLDATPKRPIIDVRRWVNEVSASSPIPSNPRPHVKHGDILSSKDLVRYTDPMTIRYIQFLTSSTPVELPSFTSLSAKLENLTFDRGRPGGSASSIEEVIAPHALLSQCLARFVKVIVDGGVEQARLVAEQVKAREQNGTSNIRISSEDNIEWPDVGMGKQMLTASHVLKGLEMPGRERWKAVVAILGVPLQTPNFAPSPTENLFSS